MRLLQIVPAGAQQGAASGVCDFAAVLAEALRSRHGIASGIAAVPERSTRAIGAAIGGETLVLVHYANYGYAARGCPRWLVAGLARWRRQRAEHRLFAVFHELWASGGPRSSSFWLEGLQRRLAFALARATDGAATTLPLYAGLLAPAARDVAVMAMASTVGEPGALTPFAERSPRLVVFGGRGARERAFGPLVGALELACDGLGAEEIWNVGPPLAAPPSRLGGRHVISTGTLAAEEVSALLARSRWGFLAYPPGFLGKSSAFAAYCAHGLATAVAWDGDPGRGDLEAGVHYLDATPAGILRRAGRSWAEVAAAAQAWYRGHDLAAHAALTAGWLGR